MSRFKCLDHLDASENFFASRQLEQIRTKTLEVRYPALLARTLIPSDPEPLDPGAETHVTIYTDESGEARYASDLGGGGPRVDVKSGEFTGKIRTIEVSYATSMQEMRAAKLANRDISAKRAIAARNAIERKIDDALMFGSVLHGFRGLLNQPAVTTTSLAAPWAGASAAQLFDDLMLMDQAIPLATNEVEAPTDIVLPIAMYNRLLIPRSTTSDTTVLAYFLQHAEHVKTVTKYRKMGTNQALAYNKSPEKLYSVIPLEFFQYQPQMHGKELVTECEARVGGVVVNYPGSMRYFDGFV
jgi:hypothetical protein